MKQPASIIERIAFLKNHPVWRSQYRAFVDAVSALRLNPDAKALSVSCGDGLWDYLALKSNPAIKSILATDVVDCPVKPSDIEMLNSSHSWSFTKVTPDAVLPVRDSCCDLVFHQDVIEHTARPFLLLKENCRVLKDGGYLLFGTPNIFRPANILKLFSGRLVFPWRLPGHGVSGACVHVQEFNEYHLKTMAEEVGFQIMAIRRCFFGMGFLNIRFCDFPKTKIGGSLCQYLFIVARKERRQDFNR